MLIKMLVMIVPKVVSDNFSLWVGEFLLFKLLGPVDNFDFVRFGGLSAVYALYSPTRFFGHEYDLRFKSFFTTNYSVFYYSFVISAYAYD